MNRQSTSKEVLKATLTAENYVELERQAAAQGITMRRALNNLVTEYRLRRSLFRSAGKTPEERATASLQWRTDGLQK